MSTLSLNVRTSAVACVRKESRVVVHVAERASWLRTRQVSGPAFVRVGGVCEWRERACER